MANQTGIVDIHGKQYKTVSLRVSEFRDSFPITMGWRIHTECLENTENRVVMKALVINPQGELIATGHAEEFRKDSNRINLTSAMENAETSAIGRALAACGYLGTEYASLEEIALTGFKAGGVHNTFPDGGKVNAKKLQDYMDEIQARIEAEDYPGFVELWDEMTPNERTMVDKKFYPKGKMREWAKQYRDEQKESA